MIVKNEEKYLRGCLESVKNVADEIVIVDTGSTDNTINIANEFNAKVFHFEWVNDFAAARNFALEKSTGEWILYLDADERLLPESKEEVLKLSAQSNKQAYNCFINNIDNINNKSTIMSYVRFFPNNPNLRFEGSVHEQIISSLNKNNIKIIDSNVRIEHLGYGLSESELKVKAGRNLELLLKEYEKKKSSYIAYQLGQTYGVLEDKGKAASYFNEALADRKLKPEYKSTIYRYLSIKESESGNYTDAAKYIRKSIMEDPNQPFGYLAAVKIFMAQKDFSRIQEYYEKALEVNSKMLQQKTSTAQLHYYPQNLIVYDALVTAVKIKSVVMFNNFYAKYGNIVQDKNELKLFDLLINNRNIGGSEIENLLSAVKPSNIELVCNLISMWDNGDKAAFYDKLYEKYPDYPPLLIKFGQYLAENNNMGKAGELFEKALNSRCADPSVVFYLVSLYIRNNRLDKIKPLMEKALELYSANYEFMQKFEVLKQKLQGYV